MSVGRYSQLDSGSYARESSHNGTYSQSSSYTSRDERIAPVSSVNKDTSDYTRDRHHSVSSSSHSQRTPPHANNNDNNDYKQNNNNNVRPITSSSSSHRAPQTPAQRRNLWGSRSVDLFEKIEAIGEGTYGEVYMARSKETGEIVALKKIRMESEKEGFPITAIREIKILKELHHDNIIQLKEIVTSKATRENKGKASIYMVFEYMDHDLAGLLMSPNEFRPTAPQIKCYMKQLLEGLHHCHSKGVLHRDLKGSNLLISNKGQLKLADFGLARTFSENNGHYTNRVITLWYRPPELLLGAVQYGPAIDMWSAGCILAELLEGKPIFPGKHEIDQLELICTLCGTPSEENWSGVSKLPWFHMFKPNAIHRRNLRERFKNWDKHALDLVDRLLTLDPSKRLSALDALDHDYFWNDPMPCDPSALPKYSIASHELQAKKRKQIQQQDKNKRMKMNGNPPPQPYPPQGPPPGKSNAPYPPFPGGPYPDRPPNGSHPQHRASYPPSHPTSHPPAHSSYPHSSHSSSSHPPPSGPSSSQAPRGPPNSGQPPPPPSNGSRRPDQPPGRSGPPPIHRPPSDNRPPLPPPMHRPSSSGGPPPPRQGPPPSDRDRRPPPRDGRSYPPEN